MVTHLGRLKVVTRRTEGKCTYLHCLKERKLLPGDQALVLSIQGKLGDKLAIFWKGFHPECLGPWVEWKCNQIPLSRNGRKIMDLSPDDKLVRQKLIRTRARLLRSLRNVSTGDKLSSLVERITALDTSIRTTGYPTIMYRGRRSITMLLLDRFVEETKKRYLHARRVPVEKWKEARELGIEAGFDAAMDEWFKECTARTIERQGKDYETGQEDREEE